MEENLSTDSYFGDTFVNIALRCAARDGLDAGNRLLAFRLMKTADSGDKLAEKCCQLRLTFQIVPATAECKAHVETWEEVALRMLTDKLRREGPGEALEFMRQFSELGKTDPAFTDEMREQVSEYIRNTVPRQT